MRREESKTKNAALLWDESFLWGVMAHKALCAAGLPFDLIRSADVRAGRLSDYSLLFVPGGWASNKIKALGPEGVEAIRGFVGGGGSYLGFCGGAGLATEDGIGLVPVRRRPTKDRVPSFSGRIRIQTNGHEIWNGIDAPVFHAWWPSQFVVDSPGINVIAFYGEALSDAYSSDVNVGEADARGGWAKLEHLYGINLDPARLKGEPAVIEGRYGKGRVLLSLIHFDTPEDRNGATVLRNLWKYLVPAVRQVRNAECGVRNIHKTAGILKEIENAANGLIVFGEQHQLWSWRNSMLLQWKRGVRGLEYCTLAILVREIADRLDTRMNGSPDIEERLRRIRSLLLPFAEKAQRLLAREHSLMQSARITYERCDDPEIQALRDGLFSRSKSHGGAFKELLDELDGLLYWVITS